MPSCQVLALQGSGLGLGFRIRKLRESLGAGAIKSGFTCLLREAGLLRGASLWERMCFPGRVLQEAGRCDSTSVDTNRPASGSLLGLGKPIPAYLSSLVLRGRG